MNADYCEICCRRRRHDETVLSEIARSENRTVMDWFKQLREGDDHHLKDVVMDYTRQRMEEEAEKYGGELAESDGRENFGRKVLPTDVERCLERYVHRGEIVLEEGRIKITHRGARKVANLVRLKLEDLNREKSGAHRIKEVGHGLELTQHSRKYEFGDTLQHVDINRTLIYSLERNIGEGNGPIISLDPEDFHVYEQTFEARMCIGLLIDESGSMMDEVKRSAAIDMCLALGRLKKPGDVLKVLIYAAEVKEIPYWDILNVSLPGGTTDMTMALQEARKALRREKGDKQIYLITDAEPNTENGKYVGFEKAVSGVKREALQCRRDNVAINIVMLDSNSKLRKFAGHLARLNAGRIFFAPPSRVGEVVVRDFLFSPPPRPFSFKGAGQGC